MDARRLCIVAGERTWGVQTKTLVENLRKLSGLECRTMLSGIPFEGIDADTAISIGVSDFRLTVSMLEGENAQNLPENMAKLAAAGVDLHVDGIEKQRYQPLLNKMGVQYTAGILSGGFVPENELVERELAELDAQQ